jgi:transposase InsO family protein
MPWKDVDAGQQRLEFVIRASRTEASMTALCREFSITRKTGYEWLKRYQQGGAKEVLAERSRRPRHSPKQAAREVVEALQAARLKRPDWGVRKLARAMAADAPALVQPSLSTLQRILDREGLIEARDRQQIAPARFERAQPNELWQMDFKGPQGFNKGSGPLSILDDHSRYLLALRQLQSADTANVKAVLTETFEQCGLPERLLLDHGKPWWDSVNRWGWTELTVWILRQGIRIGFCRVRHPQTQGKVERMHGALQRAVRKRKPTTLEQTWLDEFRAEYNQLRPHEGIGMTTPSTRWQASPRKFNPAPGDWNYPEGWETVRLAGAGQFRSHGRRWDVSQALRGQLVALQVVGHKILVHYCNMVVREIDLQSGSTTALGANPFWLLKR